MTRLATLVLLGALGACVPKAPPCVVPVSAGVATGLLEGTWQVRAYDGVVDGEIAFEGPRVRTRWQGVTLVGTWTHLASGDNAHFVRLTIDEAWEGEVRTRYSRFDEVDVRLVFANADHLYALQTDGAWTEWTRVPETFETAPAP